MSFRPTLPRFEVADGRARELSMRSKHVILAACPRLCIVKREWAADEAQPTSAVGLVLGGSRGSKVSLLQGGGCFFRWLA
jgi:hypothetical protein